MAKQVRVYGTLQKTVIFKKHVNKWIYHRKGEKAGQKWYKADRIKKIIKTYTRKVEKQFSENDGPLNKQIADWVKAQQEFGKGGYDWIEKDDDS